jgi:hypothetical protein
MQNKAPEGKGNKYEALSSPLSQQNDQLGSFIVFRELDCGSKRLRSFDARWNRQILNCHFFE